MRSLPMSLAVVGVNYPNRKGPTRRFEVEVCRPGEIVYLVPEPKNPADPRAIAVFSNRNVQMGYVPAERCGLIGRYLALGIEIRAIFQCKTEHGAAIRVTFDGSEPTLPTHQPSTMRPANKLVPVYDDLQFDDDNWGCQ